MPPEELSEEASLTLGTNPVIVEAQSMKTQGTITTQVYQLPAIMPITESRLAQPPRVAENRHDLPGGRLQDFVLEWRDAPPAIYRIIKRGFHWTWLNTPPPLTTPVCNFLHLKSDLTTAIQDLVQKRAIYKVEPQSCYLSNVFLVPKRSGDLSNKPIQTKHFHLCTKVPHDQPQNSRLHAPATHLDNVHRSKRCILPHTHQAFPTQIPCIPQVKFTCGHTFGKRWK